MAIVFLGAGGLGRALLAAARTLRGVGAVALLAVAGCASGVPVERQTVVSGAGFQAVQGEARFTVRTFLPAEDGGDRREVVGARCAVTSSLYKATLVTPSRLVVPNFGPQSPEVTVDCQAGDLAGSGTATIVTRWQDAPGAWGYPWGGPWGGPYYGPYAWGWGRGYPVSDYPDLFITVTAR